MYIELAITLSESFVLYIRRTYALVATVAAIFADFEIFSLNNINALFFSNKSLEFFRKIQ